MTARTHYIPNPEFTPEQKIKDFEQYCLSALASCDVWSLADQSVAETNRIIKILAKEPPKPQHPFARFMK